MEQKQNQSPAQGSAQTPAQARTGTQTPPQQEFDFYINLAKPTLGLYVRKGEGLPDLADTKQWQFSGHVWQSELPPAVVKELADNGHAFQELGA